MCWPYSTFSKSEFRDWTQRQVKDVQLEWRHRAKHRGPTTTDDDFQW
jgi:hypothetical protein